MKIGFWGVSTKWVFGAVPIEPLMQFINLSLIATNLARKHALRSLDEVERGNLSHF